MSRPFVPFNVSVGQQFHYWTVEGIVNSDHKTAKAICTCFCGTKREVLLRNLVREKSKSCGCMRVHESVKSMDRLLNIWAHVPVKDCWTWAIYLNFVKWALRNGYKFSSDLIKIDEHLPYGPDNCKWTPRRKPRYPRPVKDQQAGS